MLEEAGIKTDMIEKLNDTDDLVKKVEIFPLEVIVRNIQQVLSVRDLVLRKVLF